MRIASRLGNSFLLIGLGLMMAGADTVRAQAPVAVHRIGFLGMSSEMQGFRLAAFRDEMQKQGFVDGRNLVIEVRWAEGHFERLPQLARELVALNVEVIVTAAPPAVRAAEQATHTIPIVMISHDPIGLGFAASYSRPGRNITGISFQDDELSTKRMELLRSLVPTLTRIMILWNREGGGEDTLRTTVQAATSLGIESRVIEVLGAEDIVPAVAAAHAWGAQGILQLASPVFTANRRLLLDALRANAMPASCEMRLYVEEGCLMTYSADLSGMFRSLAPPTARILRGAKASELPLEQPREFDLVVNLRTARELGLTVPPAVRIQMTDAVR